MELTTLYRLIGLQPEIVERLKPFHTGSGLAPIWNG